MTANVNARKFSACLGLALIKKNIYIYIFLIYKQIALICILNYMYILPLTIFFKYRS